MNISIKRFDPSQPLPQHERTGAACFDLFVREDVVIPAHEVGLVALNCAVQIPEGYALLLFLRSSIPQRKGLILANGVGVIDPFYSGDKDELMALVLNFRNQPARVDKGESIVQGMFVKPEAYAWEEVESLGALGEGYWSVNNNKDTGE